MSVERTLSIIKPDAVAKNVIGEIYSRFEKAGLKIVEARMQHLSREEAEGFYAVHRERPFFNDLVKFMTSGPVMIQALEGEDAIALNRKLMILHKALTPMQCMVQTGRILPKQKLLTFLALESNW